MDDHPRETLKVTFPADKFITVVVGLMGPAWS